MVRYNLYHYMGVDIYFDIMLKKAKTGIGCLIYSLIRIIFFILFPLCNVEGKSENIATPFAADWIYTILIIIFG